MARVLIVAHHQRTLATALVGTASAWLTSRGHDVWLTRADADALGAGHLAADTTPADADLVVSIGGDGTMLRAVQLVDGAAVPVLGVNVGLLGYLTEIEPDELEWALASFFTAPDHPREWRLEHRMMVDLAVDASSLGATRCWRALNEGVLERQEPGHTVRLQVSIDGESFTSYAADGLIVATPTGSTAYSMSARGPVVSPRHRALLLTPVAPHMLFDRSLVLDPEEIIDVEVLGHRPVALSVDGQHACTLVEGDRVSFRASAATAAFVRYGRRRFHQILRAKFGLMDR